MSLRRLAADVKANLKIWSRFPGRIAVSLLIPAMFMILFGMFFGAGQGAPPVHVASSAPGGPPPAVVQALHNASLQVHVAEEPVDRDEVRTWMRDREVTAAVWVPPDYGDNATGPNGTVLQLLMRNLNPIQSQALQTSIDGAIAQENLRLTAADPTVGLQADTFDQSAAARLSYQDFIVPGMIGVYVLSIGLFGTVGRISAFRQQNIFKKLYTTPLKRWEWLLSKMIVQLVVILLGMAVLVGIAWLAFGIEVHMSPLVVGLVVAGSLAFSALGVTLAGIIEDAQTAQMAANVVFFPMMFLSGTFFPVESLPALVQPIAQVLPLTYFVEGLRTGMVLGEVLPALTGALVTLAFAVVFLGVGSHVTDWSEA